jgi:AraC-like DNA-binding protein
MAERGEAASSDAETQEAIRVWRRAWRRRELPLDAAAGQPLTAIGVLRAGVTDLPRMRRGTVYYEKPKSQHVVLITVHGDTTCRTREQRWELAPGSVVVLPRGAEVIFRVRSEVWRNVWFMLDPAFDFPGMHEPRLRVEATGLVPRLLAAMEGMFAECGMKPGARLGPPDAHADSSPPPCALHEVRTPPPPAPRLPEAGYFYAGVVRAYLAHLLALQNVDLGDDERRLDRLWAKARASLQKPWSIETLAAEAKVSVATLQRLTQRISGKSPGDMLFELRMSVACMLLEKTDLPLKEIAERVGYGSRSSFSIAFRRYAGVSPRAFRGAGARSSPHGQAVQDPNELTRRRP